MVCVNDVATEPCKHSRDKRLPRCNRTRQPDAQHRLKPSTLARGPYGVLHQHRDCQLAYAAGHWSQKSRDARDFGWMHVANKRLPALAECLQTALCIVAEEFAHLRFISH